MFMLSIVWAYKHWGASRPLWRSVHDAQPSVLALTALTLGGPRITPLHRVKVMSSSSSRPQLTVPSPTPFWPSSSSSRSRKLRGTFTPICEKTKQTAAGRTALLHYDWEVPLSLQQLWRNPDLRLQKMQAGGGVTQSDKQTTWQENKGPVYTVFW